MFLQVIYAIAILAFTGTTIWHLRAIRQCGLSRAQFNRLLRETIHTSMLGRRNFMRIYLNEMMQETTIEDEAAILTAALALVERAP